MANSADSFTFLSHIRTPVSGHAQEPTSLDSRRRIAVELTPKASNTSDKGTTISKTADLYGAGDIVGLDPKMIAHVEPAPGARGVEPNYFPYVEFVDADFPWRYSLGHSNGSQASPWLCLLALRSDEYESLGVGSNLLERVLILNPSNSLPNFNQSWGFAHTQFNGNGESIDHSMQQPDQTVSRLLCMRQLDDLTNYTLMLVPSFEQGRLTGLGQSGTPKNWDDFAWDYTSTNSLELPVFQKWSFQTAAQEDFESLVNRLQALDADHLGNLGGTRSIYIGHPGSVDFFSPSLVMEAEGALKNPDFSSERKIQGDSALRKELADTLTIALEFEIRSSKDDGPDKPDPIVSLPVYGQWFDESKDIDPEDRHWYDKVNTDCRYRYGAGAGSRIVKRHQEAFMSDCWEQAGDLVNQARQRSLLQVSDLLVNVVVDKTLSMVEADTVISLSEPILALTAASNLTKKTVADTFLEAAVPAGYGTRQLRRLASQHTRIRLSEGSASFTIQVPTIPGEKNTPTRGKKALISSERHRISGVRSRALSRRLDESVFRKLSPRVRSTSVTSPMASVAEHDSSVLANKLTERIKALPSLKGAYLFESSTSSALEEQLIGPVLEQGVADYLKEEDPNLLIPGIEDLPQNTVTLLEENRRFLEAVAVGANHEMHRELIWREFPFDMGATVLHRFWHKGVDAEDTSADDIKAIHQWSKALGNNQSSSNTSERLVLVLKADVVRRYPQLVVALDHQQVAEGDQWDQSISNPLAPSFSGLLDKDTAYFGFEISQEKLLASLDNYYFLLFEAVGRFRFGLDIVDDEQTTATKLQFPLLSLDSAKRGLTNPLTDASKNTRARPLGTRSSSTPLSTDELDWGDVQRLSSEYINLDDEVNVGRGENTLAWGSKRSVDAANLAKAFFQKPVCAVIPAKKVLNP